MIALRQSISSCFFCFETGARLSGEFFREAFNSSLVYFLFGSSLGGP